MALLVVSLCMSFVYSVIKLLEFHILIVWLSFGSQLGFHAGPRRGGQAGVSLAWPPSNAWLPYVTPSYNLDTISFSSITPNTSMLDLL